MNRRREESTASVVEGLNLSIVVQGKLYNYIALPPGLFELAMKMIKVRRWYPIVSSNQFVLIMWCALEYAPQKT
jgi:hypothetical protein